MFRWEAGTWWDDAACYTLETFVCEDSTDLLTRWQTIFNPINILKLSSME